MDFTPQEMRMVESLRWRQRFYSGPVWKWVRWWLVLQGIVLLSLGVWLKYDLEDLAANWPKASAGVYREHLDSLNAEERLKELETAVFELRQIASKAGHDFVVARIYVFFFWTLLVAAGSLGLAIQQWHGNAKESFLLKLIDEQGKRAQTPPESSA